MHAVRAVRARDTWYVIREASHARPDCVGKSCNSIKKVNTISKENDFSLKRFLTLTTSSVTNSTYGHKTFHNSSSAGIGCFHFMKKIKSVCYTFATSMRHLRWSSGTWYASRATTSPEVTHRCCLASRARTCKGVGTALRVAKIFRKKVFAVKKKCVVPHLLSCLRV